MPFSDYKTALVTGASSGIGAAVVERLCAEGLQVHALARSADKLAELAERTGCIAHAIDVTDLAGLTALFQRQRFDILVNNAGVDRPGSLLKADAEGIDLLVDVNLRAVLHLARLALPGMVERDSGHIINITSIMGVQGNAGQSVYAGSKAALVGITKSLAKELGPQNIRVNAIAPGLIDTDLVANVSADKLAER
ncbi:SDR family oxidoreductase, partial [Pseudomonas sp.]|uniref:SDR family oxidoreductase n=1 Tax=Pseudomonas sp. TaxID=306 RepID=UPI002589B2A6